MAKNKRNLKQLFLFNGLLLVLAFILIQYSVMRYEPDVESEELAIQEEQEVVDQSVIDAYQAELSKALQASPYEPVLQGEFKKVEIFNSVEEPYNIPFNNILGKDMALEDLKGQWIVLNFWATWCPPCIVEMPHLQALQDKYGNQNVKVVAISLDRQMTPEKLRAVVARYQFGPIAAYYGDWPTIKPHFKIDALPSTYILSPNDQAVARVGGMLDWSNADANAFIESLIN